MQDLRLLISENVENWYPHIKHLTMKTLVINVAIADMVGRREIVIVHMPMCKTVRLQIEMAKITIMHHN